MIARTLNFWLWYCSAAIAVGILLLTGLISNWGEWYSPSMPYRMQTEALLHGDIALSDSPKALGLDLVWANGGVQQVWGLGVPVWRLPFEAVARLIGQPAFPDRLALGVALLLFIYGALRILTVVSPSQTLSDWLTQFRQEPERFVATLLLVIFPPIITLCRGPFNVYEEAVFYGYLYGVGLFLGLFAFQKRPRLHFFLLLSLFSGLAVFVRPTYGGYGLATTLIAWMFATRAGWKWWKCLLGPGLFGLGGLLLYFTNYLRFGSGLEFGHNLNFTGFDLIYISRFVDPFQGATYWERAKELFGGLFFVNELNGFNITQEHIVLGQAPFYRWRHFYTTTFDLTYLVVMLFSYGAATWLLVRKKFSSLFNSRHSLLLMSVLWSLIAFIPLFLFYMKHFGISSRYMLDFAPALAVPMLGIVMLAKEIRVRNIFSSSIINRTLVVTATIWLGWQLFAAELYFPQTRVISKTETLRALDSSAREMELLPDYYALDSEHRPSQEIYLNGAGWDEDGTTGPVMVLLINDVREVSLEVASAGSNPLTQEECKIIEAKVGLEPLKLSSIKESPNGQELTFSAPTTDVYRHGTQILFLAFVPPDQLTQATSPFRLLSVRWD